MNLFFEPSGDLIQKTRDYEQQSLELKEAQHRVSTYEESSTDTSTKDSLSVEVDNFRNELFATKQLLRIRDEELLKAKENFAECESALKLSENSKNLLASEIHNMRAKLNQVELENESSRAHFAELDRSRYVLYTIALSHTHVITLCLFVLCTLSLSRTPAHAHIHTRTRTLTLTNTLSTAIGIYFSLRLTPFEHN